MLERFTEEEIAQIEKELKARNRKSQKESVIGSQIERIEKLFPREIYNGDGAGLYAASEIKTALLLICDHITNNYSVKTKRTVRQHGCHLVRATCIPEGIEEKYRQAMTDIVDAIEKNNVPFSEFKRNDAPKQ